eukprot:m.66451 g.66451  ORF g.66451 m.66451 type:complete len:599 (+) comp35388_c1_seq3:1179-2975(+)
MNLDWISTREALQDIERLLRCQIWGQCFHDPVTVESCDHHFCRDCVESLMVSSGAVCPQCANPIWMRDLKANRAFANTLAMLNKLRTRVGMGPRPEWNRPIVRETTARKKPCNRPKRRPPSVSVNDGEVSAVLKPAVRASSGEMADSLREAVEIEEGSEKPVRRKSDRRKTPRRFSYPVTSRGRENTKRKGLTLEGGDGEVKRKALRELNEEVNSKEKPKRGHERAKKLTNAKGETYLHKASIKGDLAEVTCLLSLGADPNAKDNAGWTPLHEACAHGHLSVAEALVDSGAIVNMPGLDNETPLHDAVANGHVDVVKFLITKGASLTSKNVRGLLPSQFATSVLMRRALDKACKSPAIPVGSPSLPSPKASPQSCHFFRQTVLLGTGLDSRQKCQMKQLCQQLKAAVAISFTTSVTHLVTNCDKDHHCPRTLKYLQAIATGKWIVRFQWIVESLEKGSWQDEENYEVRDAVGVRFTLSPSRARQNAANKLPGLFNGCQFYLHGDFLQPMPSREQLSTLIGLAGGHLLAREPRAVGDSVCDILVPYHNPEGGHSWVFVVYDSKCERRGPLVEKVGHCCSVVPITWLLDCITKFKLDTPF